MLFLLDVELNDEAYRQPSLVTIEVRLNRDWTLNAGKRSRQGRTPPERLASSARPRLAGHDHWTACPFKPAEIVIWVLTPKTGRDGHVEPSEIAEAVPTAGLAQTSSVSIGSDWSATRLVSPKSAKTKR